MAHQLQQTTSRDPRDLFSSGQFGERKESLRQRLLRRLRRRRGGEPEDSPASINRNKQSLFNRLRDNP